MAAEITGTVAGEAVRCGTSAAKARADADIDGEWNACAVRRRAAATPRAARADRNPDRSSSAPATTVWCGPFSAATVTPVGSSPSSAARARTAAMAPGGAAAMARPRAATIAATDDSGSIPATAAATISPTLWPSMADGVTPQCSTIFASAYSTANSSGWATAVSSRSSSVPSDHSCRTSAPAAASASSAASSSAVNVGSVRYSPAAMATCWEPCPGKRNATGRGPAERAANGSRATASTASGRDAATANPRTGWRVRPSCRVDTVAGNCPSPDSRRWSARAAR